MVYWQIRKPNDETELHQIALIVESQLIDGEEDVKVLTCETDHTHDSTCASYTVYYRYDGETVKAYKSLPTTDNANGTEASASEVTASIKQICGEDNASLVNSYLTVTCASGVLTLTYQHAAKTASVWTLGA